MEGVSATVYKRVKTHWRRKGYERLNPSNRTRVAEPAAADGGPTAAPQRRRFFRFKVKLKLKLRGLSPKKLLLGLRDAYVNFMTRIANTRAVGGGGLGGGYAADGFTGFGLRPVKEYDEKVIAEIYKSIVKAQGQLVPRDAAWVGSEISCRRR